MHAEHLHARCTAAGAAAVLVAVGGHAQLVAAAFWAFLWGPIGLILSGPLTVCLLVLGRHVRRFDFLEVLLGDQPALDPKVAVYQRLAARDQDEAAEVAVAHAKENSAEVTFDDVLVPALCLARRDNQEGDLDAADLRYVNAATREIAEEVAELREVPAGAIDDRNAGAKMERPSGSGRLIAAAATAGWPNRRHGPRMSKA